MNKEYEKLYDKVVERMSNISFPEDSNDTITISKRKLTEALTIMLEESADSNAKWWENHGAIRIDENWEILNEADIKKIHEAMNALAEVGLLDIEQAFKCAEIKKGISHE